MATAKKAVPAKKAPAKKAAAAPAARPAAKKAPAAAPAPKAEAPVKPAAKPVELGSRYLGQGDTGPDVEHLQKHIGDDLVVDGAFGPKTEKAVKRWQKAAGRQMTGEIRKADWRAILAADEVSDPAE